MLWTNVGVISFFHVPFHRASHVAFEAGLVGVGLVVRVQVHQSEREASAVA